MGPTGTNPLPVTPPHPSHVGSGESLQGIDCQSSKSEARVKRNNHARGEKLEK